ncbi:DUF3488 and transglutaminase-like domain-containing protein [bacterium]|nr:DUF3488 and transglutaminase-like domain-containing protein [bacterium]
MAFTKAFRVLTMLAVMWAFLTLALTGQLHWPAIVIFVAFYVLAIFRHRIGFRLSGIVWGIFSFLAIVATAYVMFVVNERMYAVTYLLLYLEINKMLTAEKNRDYLQLYGLTFFQVLAASVATTSIGFAPMLLVYLFIMIGTMITFTIKRDAEMTFAHQRSSRRRPKPDSPFRLTASDRRALSSVASLAFLNRRQVLRWAGTSLIVFIVGAVIFWIVPRARQQNFIPGLGTSPLTVRKSGFAENVEFGGVGQIQTDPTIIMRAEPTARFVEARPEYLRIRGTSLDEFTGVKWVKSDVVKDAIYRDSRSNFVLMDPDVANLYGDLFEVRITVEPDRSNYIFTLNQPQLVELESGREMEVDRKGRSLKMASNRQVPISYVVEGRLQSSMRLASGFDRSPPRQEGDSNLPIFLQASRDVIQRLPTAVREFAGETFVGSREDIADENNLQMPTTADMRVITETAREWTEGMNSKIDMAREIERRFRTEYGYSLDNDYSNQPNHLSYFLRVARSGHCEYFATAMTMMLRSVGVPARIVNGYLTDEWSRTGGYFVVRQEHAHSWVEARVDNGPVWVTFDPTPAQGIGSNRIGRSFYHRFSSILDALKLKWYQMVVDYSAHDQRSGFIALLHAMRWTERLTDRSVNDMAQWWRGEGHNRRMNGRQWLGALLLLAAMGVGAFLIWSLTRRKRRTTKKAPKEEVAREPSVVIRAYLDLIADLQKHFPRSPGQTPLAYAQTVAAGHAPLQDFLPLTQQYYHARYRGAPWTEELESRAAELRLRLRENTTAEQSTESRKTP